LNVSPLFGNYTTSACLNAGSVYQKPVCGNGKVENGQGIQKAAGAEASGGGEECDLGALNGQANSGCSKNCLLTGNATASCGNGAIDTYKLGDGSTQVKEQCDMGAQNGKPGSGCSKSCLREGSDSVSPPTTCGNNDLSDNEQCDDGANDGTYGTCNPDCTLAPRCGDSIVQPEYGEDCEPKGSDDPTCTAACRFPGGCGDGKIESPEECDDGAQFNTGDYGACAPSCIFAPHCGDGIKNGPEECDDGVWDSSYGGCTPQCKQAPHCGDSIVNGPEECDHGADNGVDGLCTSSCKTIIYLPP